MISKWYAGYTNAFMKQILRQVCLILENRAQKTVTTTDVVFVLNRMGTPIYVRRPCRNVLSIELANASEGLRRRKPCVNVEDGRYKIR